jgi:hypothetical protein
VLTDAATDPHVDDLEHIDRGLDRLRSHATYLRGVLATGDREMTAGRVHFEFIAP